jgi:hypothetical protein
MSVVHVANFYAGWAMVLASFLTGSVLGLFFHREQFLGGYGSFRRRVLRLGHVALAALGMMNVLYALCPSPAMGSWAERAASSCFVIGGVSMPTVCFLTAWHARARVLFAAPVVALVLAVVLTLCGGRG